jgi:hypothetical protein
MQVCIAGTEGRQDNPTEDEDNSVVFFVVGLTGVAKRFLDVLDVLKASVFAAKRQIH